MRQKKVWVPLGVLLWGGLQAQQLIPYRKGDKWGYCNPDKKVVIPPKYEFATPFYEGLAAAYRNGNVFLIDQTGREIVAPKKDKDYDEVGSFSEGLRAVKLNGKWGFIDQTGREIVPPKYDDARAFHEGLAAVGIGKWEGGDIFIGKSGYIDQTGRRIVSRKYDDTGNFHEGLARVKLNGKDFYIKVFHDGKVIEY